MEFTQAWAEINRAHLQHNLAVIRRATGERVKLAAVVKGDAYGHGLLEMARCLEESRQVDLLVAGTVNEGIRLRAAGVALPILLLPPLDSRLAAEGAGAYSVLDALLDYNLTASVYTVGFARELHLRSREHGTKAEVHIRIDTNRGGYGVPAAQFPAVLRELGELEGLQISGVYTHLYDSYAACPEEGRRQLELFDSALAGVPPQQRAKLIVHAANSRAIFAWPHSHYDLVRAGAALYGFPCGGISGQQLKPVLTLKSRIIGLGNGKDTHFGYCESKSGGKRQAEGTQSAFVSIGNWDAPFLLASNRGYARLRGQKAAILGVCMDVLAIDISALGEVVIGEEVLFTGETIPLQDWINACGLNYANFEKLLYTGNRLQRFVV